MKGRRGDAETRFAKTWLRVPRLIHSSLRPRVPRQSELPTAYCLLPTAYYSEPNRLFLRTLILIGLHSNGKLRPDQRSRSGGQPSASTQESTLSISVRHRCSRSDTVTRPTTGRIAHLGQHPAS